MQGSGSVAIEVVGKLGDDHQSLGSLNLTSSPPSCDGIVGIAAATWGTLTTPWQLRTDTDGGMAIGKNNAVLTSVQDNIGMGSFSMCCEDSATVKFRAMVEAPDDDHKSFQLTLRKPVDSTTTTKTWDLTTDTGYKMVDMPDSWTMTAGDWTLELTNKSGADATAWLRGLYITEGSESCTFGPCDVLAADNGLPFDTVTSVTCNGVLGVAADKWATLTSPWINATQNALKGSVGRTKEGGDNYTFDIDSGKAVFNLDCSSSQSVTFEATVWSQAPTGKHDSFWTKLDSESENAWQDGGTNSWTTVPIPEKSGTGATEADTGSPWTMNEGSHTFAFYNREDGTWLKSLMITSGDAGCKFVRASSSSSSSSSLIALGDDTVDSQLNSSTSNFASDKTMRREAFQALQTSVQVNHHGSFHSERP
jgi:hypothetical protein